MRWASFGLVLLVLTACGSEANPGADSSEPTTTTGLSPHTTTSRVGGGDSATVPEWFVDEGALPTSLEENIRTALAERTGAEPSAVALVGSMSVQWPNSGLGCASQGEMSMQVITDGYLAYFEVSGSTYRVHTDLDSTFRICELPDLTEPPPRA